MPRKVRVSNQGEIQPGDWVPTHAVKFNEDGTVDLMTEAPSALSNRRRNPGADVYEPGLNQRVAEAQKLLKSRAEYIASQYSELWKDLVLDIIHRVETRYNDYFPASVEADLVTYGMSQVRKYGLPRQTNIQGYKDASGRFHPIRWDSDYEPDEVGEDKEYTISPTSKFYRMSGEAGPKRRKKKRR